MLTFKIPQGGHAVVAAVTLASLLLVGTAGFTVVLETPLTQALAAAPAGGTVVRVANDTPQRAKLARCACQRWQKASTSTGVQCAVDDLVISQDWVVARLNLRTADLVTTARPAMHAVEVMHLTDGHVDEDWPLASRHEWR